MVLVNIRDDEESVFIDNAFTIMGVLLCNKVSHLSSRGTRDLCTAQ